MGLIMIVLLFLFGVMHSNRLQIWICLDQFLNAALWGWADETLSARAWRCRYKKSRWMWMVRIINCIVCWQENHCRSAYESEKRQRHIAPQYRQQD